MKWNGKDYRPLVPQKIVFKEKKFDVEEYIKSLAEKFDKIPVWRAIPNPIGVNVSEPSGPPPTPSITPSNTPTVSITASPTVTPSITASQTNTPTPSITPPPTGTPTNTPSPTETPITSPTPSSTPLPIGFAEADLYLETVLQAGGNFGASGSTVSGATRTFFNTIWVNGWNTSIKAMYPMLGGISGSTSINAISPGTFDISWSGGVTHNAVGVTGDGTTGFGNCGFLANSINANAYSMTFYSRTNSSRDEVLCGADSTIGDVYFFNPRAGAGDFGRTRGCIKAGGSVLFTTQFGNSSGAVSFQKPSGALSTIMRNAVSVSSANQGTGNDFTNIPMFILAMNSLGTPTSFSNRNISFAAFGELGVGATQSSFQSALITFQTSLGLNV